ncbi:MAG: hypothetical protein Q9170_004270 [Blastenia crenularia]
MAVRQLLPLFLIIAAFSNALPNQRWNVEVGMPSDLNPRALSPMGDGLSVPIRKRGLSPAAIIPEWTAMGDSYASGVGAGDAIPPEKPCRRFTNSYPNQMDKDPRLGAAVDHKYNAVMCSGSTFKNIQSGGPFSQADQLGNPAVATLTIGGNNVGFRAILTACIYRFYAWRSGDCNTEIANSQAIIDSPDFASSLSQAINDAVGKAQNPDFRLYVTGYAAFFNEDTDQCNNVNVALWWGSSSYWTKEFCHGMNVLLMNLNAKIAEVANGLGNSKVTYVDVDHLLNTHRFCEAPVKEPDYRNENIWFFHWYTDDRGLSVGTPWDGIDAGTCDPNTDDWGDAFHCQIAQAHAENSSLTLSEESLPSIASGSDGISPELARVFHPKTGGYSAYAQAIFEAGIQPSYTPGWCTMHVVQYQKPDPSKDNYKFDVTIFDSSNPPVNIGSAASIEGPAGAGVNVNSRLPHPVVLTAGHVDADASCDNGTVMLKLTERPTVRVG